MINQPNPFFKGQVFQGYKIMYLGSSTFAYFAFVLHFSRFRGSSVKMLLDLGKNGWGKFAEIEEMTEIEEISKIT